MRKKPAYTRSGIDVATLVIAISWVAVWFLWASVDEPAVITARSAPCRIVYITSLGDGISSYRNPERFHTPVSTGDTVEEDGMALADRGAGVQQHSRPLGRESVDHVYSINNGYNAAHTNLFLPSTYRPKWEDEKIFSTVHAGLSGTIRMETTGRLKETGFSVPGLSRESFKQISAPWQVVLSVDLDNEGRVEHVFLLSGSGDQEIDSGVVRMMYQGEIVTSDSDCSGQVIVSSDGNKSR